MRAAVAMTLTMALALLPFAFAGGCFAGTLDGFSSGGTMPDASTASDSSNGSSSSSSGSSSSGSSGSTSGGNDSSPPLNDGASSSSQPITFVQANASQTGANASSATTTLNQAVADHDAILVAFYFVPSSVTFATITDSLGNTFAIVDNAPNTPFGSNVYIAAAYDVKGGSGDQITIQGSASAQMNLLVHEYANVASLDKASHATGNTNGPDGIKSAVLTTSAPNEMLFAYALSDVATLGTGFNQRLSFDDDVTEDRIIAAPGDAQAIATMTSGKAWVILASTFKAR